MCSIRRVIVLVSMIIFFGTPAAAVDVNVDAMSASRSVAANGGGFYFGGTPFSSSPAPAASAALPPALALSISANAPAPHPNPLGTAGAILDLLNPQGFHVRCAAHGYGTDNNAFYASYSGNASCSNTLTIVLHEQAEATLEYHRTTLLDYASNALVAQFQGPGGTIRFSESIVNEGIVNEGQSILNPPNMVFSLPPGTYTLTAQTSGAAPCCEDQTTFSHGSALVDLDLYFATPECSNGGHDDGDALADWPDDPDCTSPEDISEVPDCSDGADNDLDGLVDLADPGCEDASDQSEIDPARVPSLSPLGMALVGSLFWLAGIRKLRGSPSSI